MNADAVRRQLRQRADELGLDFQRATQYYAMERFLFRLSQSAWAERFTLRLDIGIDDAVVPAPGWVDYPPLLDQPAPRILAYERATAVAEKFESIVVLGLIDSRMKDFYDLWMLAGTLEFDGPTLVSAFTATFGARGTALPTDTPAALTVAFSEQAGTVAMWQAYRSRLAASGIQAPSDLAGVLLGIAAFVLPPACAAAGGAPFVQLWPPGMGWSPRSILD
ncbi:MAG: nucleotidyl transferase AbiEii/AbiGii toxin family protein [Thermoleophilia bacterium]